LSNMFIVIKIISVKVGFIISITNNIISQRLIEE